jgi:branched-chain amino acid transport system substrate-binding protein
MRLSLRRCSLLFSSLLVIATTCLAQQEVKLGVILPLTGRAASFGVQAKNGLILAQEELKSTGPWKLTLLIQDSRGDPKVAVSAAKSLIGVHKVPLILGALRSSSTLALAPIANQNKVVLVSPASGADSITEAGDYVFRNRETAVLHGRRAAGYLASQAVKRAAVFVAQSDNALSYARYFEPKFKELGGTVVYRSEYEEKTSDFRTEIAKAKQAKAQAVYASVTLGADAGVLVRQLREIRFDGIIMGTYSFESAEFAEVAGAAAEGVLYTSPGFRPDKGEGQIFTERYRERFNIDPDAFAANSYDALRIVAAAITACGAADSECLKEKLYATQNFPGVGGVTSFDENGDVKKPVMLKTIVGRQFLPLEQE